MGFDPICMVLAGSRNKPAIFDLADYGLSFFHGATSTQTELMTKIQAARKAGRPVWLKGKYSYYSQTVGATIVFEGLTVAVSGYQDNEDSSLSGVTAAGALPSQNENILYSVSFVLADMGGMLMVMSGKTALGPIIPQ